MYFNLLQVHIQVKLIIITFLSQCSVYVHMRDDTHDCRQNYVHLALHVSQLWVVAIWCDEYSSRSVTGVKETVICRMIFR